MRWKQISLNVLAGVLAVLVLAAILLGHHLSAGPAQARVSDGIEQIDLDTIYLKSSGVEVNFSDVILSKQKENRQLIVSTQYGTVSTVLTDRIIEQLDFDFMKKTQSVSYTGTGYFVVNLNDLTQADVIEDRDKHTVTIRIDHAKLELVDIDPNNIIVDAVKESLLARGDIRLSAAEYRAIEQELHTRLQAQFNTAANGQTADANALEMVRQVYEPVVKAIDPRYSVVVQFKS